MLKKQKCKACGFKFKLEKENRYLSKKSASLLGNISEKPTIFEVFDCPLCGCQNVVGVYEQPIGEN